jgi:alpha-L-fucosidase
VGEWAPVGNKYASQQSPTIQSQWFWKLGFPKEKLMSVQDIVDKHLRVVNSRHCNLLINCAPNRDGLMDDNVVQRLKEVGEKIKLIKNKK